MVIIEFNSQLFKSGPDPFPSELVALRRTSARPYLVHAEL